VKNSIDGSDAFTCFSSTGPLVGNLVLPPGMDTLVAKAHQHQAKVLVSIGGGSHNPYYASLLIDAKRSALIEKFIQLCIDHNLDGIDVDLEGNAIDKNYDKLISDLSEVLKPKDKLLTAAFATWNANNISNAALKKFDFINIMSYDQTGPWRPKEPGQHSTYIKAEEDLNYWVTTRGLPKKKINLELPFYGYCFGTKYGESMAYGQIVEKFPGSKQQDVVVPDNGGIIYYNGLPTIKSKTILAQKKAGGVMIWQLLQDSPGNNSLFGAIADTIKETTTAH
jgi:GH18 family chitinase